MEKILNRILDKIRHYLDILGKGNIACLKTVSDDQKKLV